jgi:ubiquinone/menaquinone biosynthesis C-methylase UbiE/uncharacterized protein YbaR (Trm112 family)
MTEKQKNIRLVCPVCREEIDSIEDGYLCTNCSTTFPIVFGIPDLRISDPFFFTKENEKRRVKELIHNFNTSSYADLVKIRFRNEIRQDLLEKYVKSWSDTVERNTALLKRAQGICKMNEYFNENNIALDIGCGTGGMLVALSRKYNYVAGVDVSMESLIFAKKLLHENNCTNVSLYCCEITSLPFKTDTFDMISASNLIEHIQDQKRAVKEINRVQRKGGIFFGDIPNRFSLKPEPHVNLMFVGFFPRKLASKYVWLLKKRNYEGYLLPSFNDLVKLFKPYYKIDNIKIVSFGHIREDFHRFLSKRRMFNIFSKISSFFCHYFIVVAKKQ